jgi:Leucine-rich repeat (LRR) protein
MFLFCMKVQKIFRKLNKLSLRGNPLEKIPDVINKIKNLKILDLSE